MKKHLSLTIILAGVIAGHSQEKPNDPSTIVSAQQHCIVPSVKKAIRQIADDWKNGYNNEDAEKVATLYDS